MCFMKRGRLVGVRFLANRRLFPKKQRVSGKNAKFQFSAHKNIFDKSQIFHRTNITCSFSFKTLLAAASPHCNFKFPQNPILRLIRNCPFAPVQNMAVRLATNRLSQKILTCSTFQILLKNHRAGFEPLSGSPEGRNPRRVFGYFLHAAKSNRKNVSFGTFHTSEKYVYRPLGKFSEKKKIFPKSPFRSFPEKNRQSQSATLVTFAKATRLPGSPCRVCHSRIRVRICRGKAALRRYR